MKLIPILLILALYSSKASGQQLSYKELAGNWVMADSSEGRMTYQFKDSVNILLLFHHTTDFNTRATYTISLINDVNRLYINYVENGAPVKSAYRLKLVNPDTLKMQIDNSQFPLDWETENTYNTATLYRKK